MQTDSKSQGSLSPEPTVRSSSAIRRLSLRLSSKRGELGFLSRGSHLSPFRNLGLRDCGIQQQLAFDNAAMPGALVALDHSRRP